MTRRSAESLFYTVLSINDRFGVENSSRVNARCNRNKSYVFKEKLLFYLGKQTRNIVIKRSVLVLDSDKGVVGLLL